MARVRFSDGTVINFDGNPTPEDIEEAYSSVIATKKAPVKPLSTEPPGLGEFNIFEKQAAPSPMESVKQGGISALSSITPGGQITLKKPALAGTIAGAVEAPIATAAGVGVERLARSMAPQKYKDVAGLAGGVLGGSGVAGVGKLARKAAAPLSGRIINSMIGPKQVAFKYGKNPGRTVSKLGIVGNSLEDFGKNIDQALSGKMDELQAVITSPENSVKRIDFSDAFNTIDGELAKLNKAPGTNAAIIQKIQTLRNDLVSMAQSGGKSLSPAEALDIKRTTGDVAKWTGGDTPPQFEGLVHNIYHKMKVALENAIPSTKGLNDDIAGLIGASKAMPGALARSQRGMLPFMARTVFSGAAPFMAGAGAPGAIAGMGANLLLSTPSTGTRIAGGLAKMAQRKSRLLGI